MLSLVLVCIICIMFWYSRKKPANYPHGYNGLPLVGVLPYLSDNPAATFTKWSQNFGPIFYARMGSQDYIVLNNYEAVEECTVKKSKLISDRGGFDMYQDARPGGILFTAFTREQRTLKATSLSSIKNIGKEIEEKIEQEIEFATKEILSHNGEPFNPKKTLLCASASLMTSIVFGKRLVYSDVRLHALLNSLKDMFNNQMDSLKITFICFIYKLKYVPIFRGVYQRFQKNAYIHEKIFQDMYEEHHKTINENDLRDVLNHLILHGKLNPTNPAYTKTQIVQSVADIFDAGTDAIATALEWSILYLAKNPKFQDELYNQLFNEIGDSVPSWDKRGLIPLASSFIDEILRHRTVAPFAYRRSINDFKLFEFNVPKGVGVVLNLWGIHHNPAYFKHPDRFIPDRFIDPESNKYIKSKFLIPFGIAFRKCLGYLIIYKKLFILLCGLLQRFRINEDENFPLPLFDEGCFGIVYFPKEFKVRFVPR